MNDSMLTNLLAIGLCLLLVVVVMGARFSYAIEQQEVAIGLPSVLVIEIWGQPDHITTSEVSKPGSWLILPITVIRETWTYSSPARTVVFEDGVVIRIEKVEY